MPTVGAYVIVTALIALALLQQFYVPDIAAHFFMLYFDFPDPQPLIALTSLCNSIKETSYRRYIFVHSRLKT